MQAAIEMRGISKQFGPVKALDDVDLTVFPGSIHGLVGANGAGKSTIIKVLAGIYKLDSGELTVFGNKMSSISPSTIEAQGIHFIHQDRLLVPASTVAEAVYLNNEPTIGPFLNARKMRSDAAQLIKSHFHIDIDPGELIRNLSAAKQKIIQITRALAQNARVLVLDEPTAALVSAEVSSLFDVLRSLRKEGIAIVFISHYMQEIIDICDDVTVLRNGQNAGNVRTAESSIEEIVSLMVDRDTTEMYPQRSVSIGQPVLVVDGLSRKGHFNNVSFTLHSGEVLGLTGLLGSGDKELLNCLFGLDKPDTGTVTLNGRQLQLKSPGDAVDAGVAMIPEDRRAHGIAGDLSVSDNMSVASIQQHSSRGFVDQVSVGKKVDGMIDELGVITPDRFLPVRNLSGGNQQKVVVAKWLSCDSSIYLLDDPTVAVDVGAKVEIYNLINRLASQGKGIIFISSELDEMVEMCDRILVIYRGQIIEQFSKGEVDSDRLLSVASGSLVPVEQHAS